MCTFKASYTRLKHDIQEAECFEFTVQILPPPPGAPWGQTNFSPPALDFFFVYALNHYMCLSVTNPFFLLVFFVKL